MLKHRFRPRTHTDVFCQVYPTDFSGTVDQELGRTRDVLAVLATLWMEDAVAANHSGVRIGQNWKRISFRVAQFSGLIIGIDADSCDFDALRVQFVEVFLETP